MGFELDRLVKQYGLSTPTLQNYSGAAPTGPAPTAPTAPTLPTNPGATFSGTAPTAVTAPTAASTPAQIQAYTQYQQNLAKYNADLAKYKEDKAAFTSAVAEFPAANTAYSEALAKYNADLPKHNAENAQYLADQTAYDQYKESYRNRQFNTPMYLQSQFDTGLTPTNDPGRELYKQTGSYYGNQLQVPSSGSLGAARQATTPSGSGPSGQELTFNDGLRGYFVPGGDYGAEFADYERKKNTGLFNPAVVAGPPPAPSGVPTNAQFDKTTNRFFVPYAHGGGVRTNYAMGDLVDLSNKYDNPDEMSNISPGFINNAMAPQDTSGVPMAMVTERPAMPPQPEPKAAAAPQNDLERMLVTLSKYTGTGTDYSGELKAARAASKAESDKFAQMIQDAMKNQSSAPSKEELYWRLASAFASPTRTGTFGENASLAGKEAAEYAKSAREAQKSDLATKMQLALKGQELKAAGAKEDLTTLRTLAAEDMKDKRTITAELLKQYVKSGEAESTAGKQARDEGLKPGTPEFQVRVKAIAANNLEAQTARIESLLAGINTAQANLLLSQQKFEYGKEKDTKLTPAEVKMKSETEDLIGNANQALKDIKQAYKLNPNTFDGSFLDKGTRLLLENTASNDPKVVATRTMENLLSKEAIGKLRASFGANPTEGERAILLQLEGINSKSQKERAAIMRNTFEALNESIARQKKRLNEINAGLYRDTTKTGGIE
jgi:hypothetical protein